MPPPTQLYHHQVSHWPAQYNVPFNVEQRLEALLGPWLNRYHYHAQDPDPYKDALKQALHAFMETTQGKKLKDLLLSKRVLPVTLMIVGTALAGMIANNADIPATPDLPFYKGIKIKAEFQGQFDSPTGILITFSAPLGATPPKRKPGPKLVGAPLPAKLHADIRRQIDNDALADWIIQQAAWEYEIAGPDTEPRKKQFYHHVNNRRGDLPDTQLVAEALAREFVSRGKSEPKRMDFDLHHAEIWNKLDDLRGLVKRLRALVSVLTSLLPQETAGIESVAFMCGKRIIPINTK